MVKKIVIILLILISLPMFSMFFKMYIVKNPITKGFVGNVMYSTNTPIYEYYLNPLTGTVYRSKMGNWFSLSFSEVPGADGKTFENLGMDLGRDKKSIYLKDKSVYSIKNDTQIVISQNYDHYNLKIDGKYYFIENDTLQEIPSENPENIQFLGEYLSYDDKDLYYRSKQIYSFKNKNPKIEKNKENIFSIDGNIYVLDTEKKEFLQIPNADFKTIEHVGGFFLRDKNSLFYKGIFLMKLSAKDELRADFPYIKINGSNYELRNEKELILSDKK